MASHNVCQPMTEANGMDSAPPQFALLDMFFPGFSTFSRAIEKYFKIDLNLYIPLILLLGAITFAWQYFTEAFWDQLESYFMSVVDIRQDDEIYNMLMAWVAQQRFSQGARRFVVNTNLNSRSWYLRRWEDDQEEEGDDGETDSLQQETKKKALAYTPTFGSHYFWHKGRIYIFRRDKNRDQQGTASEREEISISCFGRDPGVLKELLLEARAQFIQRDEHKTLIYRGTVAAGGYCPSWQRCLARASRPFSTVILNDKVKQDLIDDVRDYLDPATRRWYSNRGIPYRRGYLLYGPPGTGKSSLSLALAGFFKMRIYIVSLSSPFSSEETLGELFAELPRRCVVLLEDIDTAGLTHTREENKGQNDNGDGKTSDMTPGKLTTGNDNNNNNNNNNNNSNGRLSLSGLLNILDGVASQEGRVLIMTTNHIEKLDKALIRPGRVDMMVQFGLADAGMIVSIFKAIFAPLEGDDPELITPKGASPRDVEEVMKRVAADSARRDEITVKVEKLAEEFAKKVPAHEFSPAELQGLLLKNKRDPEGAVNAAEEWVIEKRKEKAVKQLEEAEEKRKKEEAQKKAKEEEEKKKKEEEEKKAKEEEEKKKAEEEEKKKTEREEKRNKRKNKSRSKNSGRKSKKESSSDTGSDSNTSDSSSDSGSGSESESDKKKSKKETKIGVKIKVDKVSGTDEDGLKVPVSATTDRSDGSIDVEKERDDDNRSRTHGTDSGHGTAA